MNQHLRRWLPRLLVGIVAAAMVSVPVPSLAGDTSRSPSSPPGIRASIPKIVASEARAVASHVRAAAVSRQADLGSPSFFKTKAGIITLVAIAAGTGYALYSTSHDRVKSPNRTYGGGQ